MWGPRGQLYCIQRLIYSVSGDGLCAINAASAHIFEDDSLGATLRREMNKHNAKNQSYYINKGYSASTDVPFESVNITQT